jgi:intracellular multiplication protein IcmT
MGHWRNTFKAPRFFMLDARVSFFLLGFLLHMRLWTFVLLIVIAIVFHWVERFGYDFMSAIRALRLKIVGNVRPPLSDDKIRYAIDYDRRPLF